MNTQYISMDNPHLPAFKRTQSMSIAAIVGWVLLLLGVIFFAGSSYFTTPHVLHTVGKFSYIWWALVVLTLVLVGLNFARRYLVDENVQFWLAAVLFAVLFLLVSRSVWQHKLLLQFLTAAGFFATTFLLWKSMIRLHYDDDNTFLALKTIAAFAAGFALVLMAGSFANYIRFAFGIKYSFILIIFWVLIVVGVLLAFVMSRGRDGTLGLISVFGLVLAVAISSYAAFRGSLTLLG